jgi:serine/threonine-protein kinase
MASNVPAKIGKYDVIDVIGRGGMGVVYKAVDPHLDRQVAIKMMTSGFVDNPDLLKRFFREAQSLGSLQHPNIVTVYDLGDFGGNPYMVMEFMEGEGLDSVLAGRRQLSLLEKTNIIIKVCNGLSYAHGRGIVHRDIKPANIMVSKDGGVKLFDFGIAHIGDHSVTKTGQIVGTLSYMSPEQVNGKPVDARTDLFSTGVVLYQLFTNHLPFEGESTATTLLKIIYDPPPPLKNFLSSYPHELEAILQRALAKDREERYHSADEFALDLTQLQVQLKQELIGQHMHEVSRLLERADLYKAKEYLIQVLKIDQQHVKATQLLREVQARIKREEVGEQVRKLRQRAEESVAREKFETAQEAVEQALVLDKTNTELVQLRDSIKAAALRAQKLHNAVRRAETAHQDGELDTAKQAIEEAVEIAPDDPQVKALNRVIQRDWTERARQRQLENYLFEARQDISSRKFTAALEILKLAEALDPNAPQVHALIESAAAGREQERKRKDLEAISREIEDALNRDDYRAACEKADEGLTRFPDERTLVKLKALAERQRQIEERKQFIDEQLAVSRKLLQEGRNEELLTLLEGALEKIGPEPRLQSLLTIVKENVQRDRQERKKNEYLQKAKESLRNKDYDSAIQTLESARSELKNEPEIDDLLQFVREEAAAEQRRRTAEAAAEKAHAFVAEQKYEEAIRLLETTLREVPDEELRIVLLETRRAAVEYQQKLETTLSTAEKLLQARKANEALNLLESQPTAYFRSPALAKVLETARNETERLRKVNAAVERSQRVLNEEDYAGARRVLEECRAAHGSSPELEAQFSVIEQKRVAAVSRKVEKAIGDARILTMASEYQAAIDKLQSVAELVNDIPASLRSEHRALAQQNSAGLVHIRKIQIERFVAAGDLTRAAELLRQSLDQFPGDRELVSLGNAVNQETTRRSEARDRLAEAQKAFARQRWKEGGELLQRAFAASTRAPATREEILQAFVQAGISAVEADWRAAETLLQQLADLKADYAPPLVLRSRIRERKREEFIAQCTTQAKRLISTGDLQSAAREVSSGLTKYPDEATLKQLQGEILERIRREEQRAEEQRAQQEKEEFLRQVNARVERERFLNRKVALLEEALVRYPEEPRLQRLSSTTRELWERVSALVAQAEGLETAKKYSEALQQWNGVFGLYREYPELENHIARVTRLRDQARAAAKTGWLQELQDAIASSELDRGRALLVEARQQFPADRDLSRIEEQLADALKARTKAQKLLVDAGKPFAQTRWEKGVDVINRALEVAGRDAVVRDQALAWFARACESAVNTDLAAAQMLAERIVKLAPGSSHLPRLRLKIEERQREQTILEKLASARRTQQGGDLQSALRELTFALAAYPGDQRFMQAKSDVEAQLRQREEQRERDREKTRQLDLEREKLRAAEEERKRKEAAERERIRAEEEERKRKEALERERIRAEQEERKRQEALERERVRAQEAERQRQEALERERIRAEEEERKRKEDLERERQLAIQREEERKRLAALEQERAKAEAAAREQAKLREIELEQQREQQRQRQFELERERQEAEKRRAEEAQRLREETLRKEQERREQQELERKQAKERKEQEKARKRKEREKKRAAELAQRNEEEAARKAEKERTAAEAKKRKQAEVRPTNAADVSATQLFDSTGRTIALEKGQQVEETAASTVVVEWVVGPTAKILRLLKQPVVLGGAAVALLLLVLLGRWLAQPRAISIQIRTSPDAATVTVSPVGKAGEKRQCVTPNCSLDLLPGKYAVQAQRDGYEPSQQTIDISAKGGHSFSLELTAKQPSEPFPQPPPSKTEPGTPFGKLQVRGVPAVEVFVDGTSVGKIGRGGEMSTQVGVGQHQIKVVANGKSSSIVSRNFESGRVVSIGKDDFYPTTPPSPEEVIWQKTLESPTLESVEEFLRKYQSGSHATEARSMLEGLYWTKDSQTNTPDSYRDYLSRYPSGLHVAAATEEIAFFDARQRRDPGLLGSFLDKYANSRHSKEIRDLLDEVAWEHTDKNDEKSLNAYLREHPKGQHAQDAQEAQAQLADIASRKTPQLSQQETQVAPPVQQRDESKAIQAVLDQYRRAYEDLNIDELLAVWPSAARQAFNDIRSASLSLKPMGNPIIQGDSATINVTQSFRFRDVRGSEHKFDSRLNIRLRKSGDTSSPTGGWIIESVAKK